MDAANGKKYGESEVEGVDGDGVGKLAGFFCGLGRPDDGVCGAMKLGKGRRSD